MYKFPALMEDLTFSPFLERPRKKTIDDGVQLGETIEQAIFSGYGHNFIHNFSTLLALALGPNGRARLSWKLERGYGNMAFRPDEP